MNPLHTALHLIRTVAQLPSALDFHIAFYIGHFAALDPTAYFHVISKDTGFDPLIQHLKTKRVFASRWRDVSEIPLLKITKASAPQAEKVAARVEQLQNASWIKVEGTKVSYKLPE